MFIVYPITRAVRRNACGQGVSYQTYVGQIRTQAEIRGSWDRKRAPITCFEPIYFQLRLVL